MQCADTRFKAAQKLIFEVYWQRPLLISIIAIMPLPTSVHGGPGAHRCLAITDQRLPALVNRFAFFKERLHSFLLILGGKETCPSLQFIIQS